MSVVLIFVFLSFVLIFVFYFYEYKKYKNNVCAEFSVVDALFPNVEFPPNGTASASAWAWEYLLGGYLEKKGTRESGELYLSSPI